MTVTSHFKILPALWYTEIPSGRSQLGVCWKDMPTSRNSALSRMVDWSISRTSGWILRSSWHYVTGLGSHLSTVRRKGSSCIHQTCVRQWYAHQYLDKSHLFLSTIRVHAQSICNPKMPPINHLWSQPSLSLPRKGKAGGPLLEQLPPQSDPGEAVWRWGWGHNASLYQPCECVFPLTAIMAKRA